MPYRLSTNHEESTMPDDPEIEAMAAVSTALSDLEDDARGRVLEWAGKRYGVSIQPSGKSGRSKDEQNRDEELEDDDDDAGSSSGHDGAYEDFADLYDAANPQKEDDRALVAAYWWQVLQEEGSVTGYRVNESLRNMGHQLSNVTKSMGRLQKQQPALVRQMTKSGKSKQARKTYKLTTAGIKAVEAMIA